jgi:DNA-binding response OmpR family regulator
MKQKYKILIVEDEDSIRRNYADYLNMEGFEVEEAPDGEEALKKIKTFDFDLLLLDIILPSVDGLDVLKEVKSDVKTKNKKVIMLTALGRDSVIKKGFELGADAYLIKDHETPETVKNAILKALEGS